MDCQGLLGLAYALDNLTVMSVLDLPPVAPLIYLLAAVGRLFTGPARAPYGSQLLSVRLRTHVPHRALHLLGAGNARRPDP